MGTEFDLQQPWPHQRPAPYDCNIQADRTDGEVPRYAGGQDGSVKAMTGPSVYNTSDISELESISSSQEDSFTIRKSSEPSSPALFTFTTLPIRPKRFIFPCLPSRKPSSDEHAAPPLHKRIRHSLDVDGPNTAALACKKRRLRVELITSRLSQPFSQPATHILNREGQKQGDKRFVKMAAKLDLARRVAYLHATYFRRFSVMNRWRRSLDSEPRAQVNTADPLQAKLGGEGRLDTSCRTLWRPDNLQASSRGMYLRPSGQPGQPHQPRHPVPHPLRLLSPAALPLPSADLAAAQKRTSPRIHPVRSPEHCPMPSYHEDPEEDSFAFLHANEDEDDDGDVYSDFGVIFGGGGSEGKAEDDHSYEEYLDELDGLAWVSR